MKTKTITLSTETWEIIAYAVSDYRDMGPPEEGWQSDELNSAQIELRQALKDAKEN